MGDLSIATGSAFDSATLTGSYAAGEIVDCLNYRRLSLLIDYDPDTADKTVKIKVEFSDDRSTWYQINEVNSTATASNLMTVDMTPAEYEFHDMNGAGNNSYHHMSMDINAKYFRISAYETGSPGDYGDLEVTYRLSNK